MLNINIWDILWTVVNLILFFFLLKKFLFNPVLAVLAAREAQINNDLEQAKHAKEESEQMKEQYEAQLSTAQEQADKIAAAAKQHADKESAEIINDAHAEAALIISKAHKSIEHEREEALDSARSEIAGLAVMAASQVLAKNMDSESNRVLAEQLLSEVGAENG